MGYQAQLKIPATYMRGGTSKGVFFRLEDLPVAARQPGAARDALLLRGELLDLFLRRLGAVFRSLRPVFRLLQAFFQGDQTGFDRAEIRLRVG